MTTDLSATADLPELPAQAPDGCCAADGEGHQHGYITDKDAYLKRLRRIEGQARGLQRMVEDEKYCMDILVQVSAMTKALQAVSIGLLEDHLKSCVVDAARTGGEAAEVKMDEAMAAIRRLARS